MMPGWLRTIGWSAGAGAMRFRNREEAAKELAGRLAAYKGQNPLILGVPRGAVPMARTIADALEGDLDVVLVRKLRAPGQPELAIGAVDESGAVLKGSYFNLADEEYLSGEIRTQQGVIRARREMYTRAQKAIDPAGRIVVVTAARQGEAAVVEDGGDIGGDAALARP